VHNILGLFQPWDVAVPLTERGLYLQDTALETTGIFN